jgi:hypothetical protein
MPSDLSQGEHAKLLDMNKETAEFRLPLPVDA